MFLFELERKRNRRRKEEKRIRPKPKKTQPNPKPKLNPARPAPRPISGSPAAPPLSCGPRPRPISLLPLGPLALGPATASAQQARTAAAHRPRVAPLSLADRPGPPVGTLARPRPFPSLTSWPHAPVSFFFLATHLPAAGPAAPSFLPLRRGPAPPLGPLVSASPCPLLLEASPLEPDQAEPLGAPLRPRAQHGRNPRRGVHAGHASP